MRRSMKVRVTKGETKDSVRTNMCVLLAETLARKKEALRAGDLLW